MLFSADAHILINARSERRYGCAAAVGCSTSALNKVFRRQLNSSVARHIREIRLQSAYELLRAGASVSETGRRCGFGSTETFHRLFKERFGLTPGQIRSEASEAE